MFALDDMDDGTAIDFFHYRCHVDHKLATIGTIADL